ncbi:hypothetical protein LCGC14_0792980 [marine sediment metagenome]|uniref:Uncharacterized protein n=1 Tax=marine sediment metagenome TaxID=412755 RepID=A0A0F9SZ36_9ZZZZ
MKNQAEHHAPDEPKSRAIALRAEGYTVPRIAGLVEHSERTVHRWLSHGREVARNQEIPEIQDDWVRIVRRSQGMQHAVLDVTESYAAVAANDHPGPLAEIARQVAAKELMKHAVTYNIYAGTGTDKLQKESQPTEATNIQINFISQAAPDE